MVGEFKLFWLSIQGLKLNDSQYIPIAAILTVLNTDLDARRTSKSQGTTES